MTPRAQPAPLLLLSRIVKVKGEPVPVLEVLLDGKRYMFDGWKYTPIATGDES